MSPKGGSWQHTWGVPHDPAGLFNSSLEGNTRRAIDITEGGTIDAAAFKALIREAVAFNMVKKGPTLR